MFFLEFGNLHLNIYIRHWSVQLNSRWKRVSLEYSRYAKCQIYANLLERLCDFRAPLVLILPQLWEKKYLFGPFIEIFFLLNSSSSNGLEHIKYQLDVQFVLIWLKIQVEFLNQNENRSMLSNNFVQWKTQATLSYFDHAS